MLHPHSQAILDLIRVHMDDFLEKRGEPLAMEDLRLVVRDLAGIAYANAYERLFPIEGLVPLRVASIDYTHQTKAGRNCVKIEFVSDDRSPDLPPGCQNKKVAYIQPIQGQDRYGQPAARGYLDLLVAAGIATAEELINLFTVTGGGARVPEIPVGTAVFARIAAESFNGAWSSRIHHFIARDLAEEHIRVGRFYRPLPPECREWIRATSGTASDVLIIQTPFGVRFVQVPYDDADLLGQLIQPKWRVIGRTANLVPYHGLEIEPLGVLGQVVNIDDLARSVARFKSWRTIIELGYRILENGALDRVSAAVDERPTLR